jgi:hypothetical protein
VPQGTATMSPADSFLDQVPYLEAPIAARRSVFRIAGGAAMVFAADVVPGVGASGTRLKAPGTGAT